MLEDIYNSSIQSSDADKKIKCLKISTIPAYKAQTLTMNKMNRILNKIIYMKILTIPANKAQTPTINRMLKTADPTIVPTPTSLFAINTPIKKHTNFLACFPHFFSSLSITSEYQIYEVYLCNECLSPLTL